MEKTKIARIVTRLNIGGPSTHVILLTKGLNDSFKTILVAGKVDKGEGEMLYLAREEGVLDDIRFCSYMKRPVSLISDIRALYSMFSLLRKERPLIVHTHTAKAGFLGRLAAFMAGVPIKVHSFHGHCFHSYFGRFETRIFLAIERLLARFTDRIVVVSDSIKEDVCGKFKVAGREKTSVIELGLDLDKFRDAAAFRGSLRKELGLGDDCLLIGIVGRLTAVKNHLLFLDAVSLLARDKAFMKYGARFPVIGDGELRKTLENRARELGIEDKVFFLGWRRDAANFYGDLDIVVLTSLNEGTPLSIIEAMAAKKPVVATAVGGVPDLIEDGKTGILVPPNDPERLKAAIISLCSDEALRRRLGENASEYVLAKYSKQRLMKDMENLYSELIRIKRINKDKEEE
ncbi:MAG: glycosyltransferase family 4 protein [Candidatus Omnitrophica bacterium]|nr:glycosyltransferase family 4 protein [Candidatus Omnitrophota bacterium]